ISRATRSRAWGSAVWVSSAYFLSRNSLSKKWLLAALVWETRIISSAGLRATILGQMQQALSLARFTRARWATSMVSSVASMPTFWKYTATASASWGISGLASCANDQILAFRVPAG